MKTHFESVEIKIEVNKRRFLNKPNDMSGFKLEIQSKFILDGTAEEIRLWAKARYYKANGYPKMRMAQQKRRKKEKKLKDEKIIKNY